MLIHQVSLPLPWLPESLQGLRIAHLTDLHITRAKRCHQRLKTLLKQIKADMVLLTGDYMTWPGDEAKAAAVMTDLTEAFEAPLGCFGVFGNHDTLELRDRLAGLPVHWLANQSYDLPDVPVQIIGMETLKRVYPDSVAMLSSSSPWPRKVAPGVPTSPRTILSGVSISGDDDEENSGDTPGGRVLRVMLCHHPTYLPTAADLGMDIMLSGHTHGGQCRLPGRRALINSTDLPMSLTAGVLRHQHTLALVSRGLGEVHLPIRLFCPRQLPVYQLTRGPLMGRHTQHIHNTSRW